MLTIWRTDFPTVQIEIEGATPDEWIYAELLDEIKETRTMRDKFDDGWSPLVSWDEANQAVTFHCKSGNVVYRLTGEYDHKKDAYRMVWPD